MFPKKMNDILIVDDNEDLLLNLSSAFKREGYNTLTANNGQKALKSFKDKSPDITLLDMRLPDMNGIQLLEEMKKINKNSSIIMVTAVDDVKNAVNAMKKGAFDYITKPFNIEDLLIIVRNVINTSHSIIQQATSSEKYPDKINRVTDDHLLLGKNPQILKLLRQIKILAPLNMIIVIEGESGVGKEIAAKLIHEHSERKDNPFIAIDCGAIPKELAESELFGYEKGAFTGADTRREGVFEQANNGTLFLDEIGNLPLSIQMKLLRVIETKKLRHIGGTKDIPIDVRIIAASNIELSKMAANGLFRKDLYFRLNEFSIFIPPLTERKDDIILFAEYFLQKANTEMCKNVKGFNSDVINFFQEYPWHGNLRELKNVIKRCVIITENDEIVPEDLPPEILSRSMPLSINRHVQEQNFSLSFQIKDVKDQIERDTIQKVLVKTNYNKTKAAKLLKIDRKTLYLKMKIYGLLNNN